VVLDILIGIPILIFILLGIRDGIVRKLVASAILIAGLILGQIYMLPVGKYLVEYIEMSPANAQQYGFISIFMGFAIVQSLVYKLAAGGYKIGGAADKLGGMVVGFIEGAIFISSLLYIFALSGFPSRESARESRFYRPIVNIAPLVLDFASIEGTEAMDKIKKFDLSSPSKKVKQEKQKVNEMDTAVVNETKRMNDMFNKSRDNRGKSK
jgi:uncharacterized membrane protein required for colicin V production